jgi:hypothetical protein
MFDFDVFVALPLEKLTLKAVDVEVCEELQ